MSQKLIDFVIVAAASVSIWLVLAAMVLAASTNGYKKRSENVPATKSNMNDIS